MSKRKNRSKAPNLPQSTLERARQQAEEQAAPVEPAAAAPEPVSPASAAPVTPQAASSTARPSVSTTRRDEPKSKRAPSARRRSDAGEQVEYRARKKELDSEAVARLLSHPTKVVTEDELRQRYSYVLADLRSMGALAAVLVVALILAARLL